MEKERWKRKRDEAKESPARAWFNLFVRFFVSFVLVFFAIFFTWYAVFLSSHNYYRVDGASMVPTLNSEIPANKFGDAQGVSYDSVYVDKKAEPNLFDVIVINTHQIIKDKTTKTIIKRLMALEGDYVTVAKTVDENGIERMTFFRIASGTNMTAFQDKDAMMVENGENGYQIYEPESVWAHQKTLSQPLTYTFKASGKETEYEYDYNFYLTFLQYYGSQEQSFDYFVSDEGLLYVQVPEGKFFYMGDNRAHSSDAREDGFRDVDDIVGPVEIVIYNNSIFKRIGTFLTYFFEEVEKFFAR